MKKIMEMSIALALVCFSFYYTDKAIDFIRSKDPLMKEINANKELHEITPINATIVDNYLIPGIRGQIISEEISFEKMKQYGKYNENLLVFEEQLPEITMNEYYDYFIEQGNSAKNAISLVFKVNNNDNLSTIEEILRQENVEATFFIDGLYIENNQEMVYNLVKDNHYIGVLNYDGRYVETYFQEGLETLKDITNLNSKYCYAEYDNKEVLQLCSKKEMHTVIPTIQANNSPFLTIKEKLGKGSVIGLSITKETEEQLATMIAYIKQRGYNLETIDTLLSESYNDEK